MLAKDPNYQRLKAGGFSISGRVSYWLGSDQLRIVEVRGVVESYRRIALRDIRAVTIRGTRMYGAYIAILGVPALLALMILYNSIPSGAAPSGEDWAVMILFGTIAAVLLFLLLRNAVLGPTCYCELVTGVQSVLLPGVSRRRRAESLIATLRAAAERDAATAGGQSTGGRSGPVPVSSVATDLFESRESAAESTFPSSPPSTPPGAAAGGVEPSGTNPP